MLHFRHQERTKHIRHDRNITGALWKIEEEHKMTAFVKMTGRKIFPAVMIAVMIISFFASTLPSNAATNICGDIYGDCSESQTFYVKTGKGWLNNQYITISQTKGKLRYARPTFTSVKYKTVKQYATYYITVVDESTGKYVMKNKEWKSGSMKIKLKKYKEYSVTVTPEKRYTYWFVYTSDKWVKRATWRVKKTRNCTYCAW